MTYLTIEAAAALALGDNAATALVLGNTGKQSRARVSYLVTRSGLQLNRVHLIQQRPYFQFESLPAEIRNKVYRNVIVAGSSNIPIDNMDPDEFHLSGDTTSLRTAYWTVTYGNEEDSPPTNPNGTYAMENRTTYCFPPADDDEDSHEAEDVARDSCAILRVNKQLRNEALPIFYADNRFVFCAEGCMIPFLQDRTAEARTCIRHIRVLMLLEEDGFNNYRQKTWVKNFNYIAANLPQLRSLQLHIRDSEGRMLVGNMDFALPPVIGGRWMKWVRPLMGITNLGAFMLEIDVGDYGMYGRGYGREMAKQEAYAVNKWLSFLEPRMLAPDVKRGWNYPKGSKKFEVGAFPRAYVWEPESEDEKSEGEDEGNKGGEVAGEDNDIGIDALVHGFGADLFGFSMYNAGVFVDNPMDMGGNAEVTEVGYPGHVEGV